MKRYVAYGPGYSGDYDSIKDAALTVRNNKAGGVYVLLLSIDMINELHTFTEDIVHNILKRDKK